MAEERIQRRLAAVAVLDVVGYSRMMEIDEPGTLARLAAQRKTVVDPIVQSHGGRVVKLMGDGALIEFASAVDAVEAAVELQRHLAMESGTLPEGQRMTMRIGINLGDVIGQGDDIYGEGVNIAARLEKLAEPGGVCLSAKVLDEVRGKVDIATEDMGDIELRNIAKPVRVHHIRSESPSSAPAEVSESEKPSIAVLCFDNMSGDPAQEYFSDGITEHIITDLARFRDLSVIARNSSFAYKGKSPNIQQVSRELGVRYILEGSVQRSGSRVRITAQLIEGESGRHLWADRYDRNIEDIFAVQDEVTETIVGTLATAYGGRLRKAWQSRHKKQTGRSFAAFDAFLRGLQSFDSFTREGVARSRGHFEDAIRSQPGYSKALAKLSWAYMIEISYGWRPPDEQSWQIALDYAEASVASDDEEAWGHWALAGYYLYKHQHDLAIAEFVRAVSLNPNDADVMSDLAFCLSYAGRAPEAVDIAKRAMRLNPHFPEWYAGQLGGIYFDAGRYADAIGVFEGLRSFDTMSKRVYLAASYAALGLTEDARQVVEHILEKDPAATVEVCTSSAATPYKESRDLENLRSNLIKAGLPT